MQIQRRMSAASLQEAPVQREPPQHFYHSSGESTVLPEERLSPLLQMPIEARGLQPHQTESRDLSKTAQLAFDECAEKLAEIDNDLMSLDGPSPKPGDDFAKGQLRCFRFNTLTDLLSTYSRA